MTTTQTFITVAAFVIMAAAFGWGARRLWRNHRSQSFDTHVQAALDVSEPQRRAEVQQLQAMWKRPAAERRRIR